MSRQKKVCVFVLLAFVYAENFVPSTICHVTQEHWANDPNLDHSPGKNMTVTIRAQTNMISTDITSNGHGLFKIFLALNMSHMLVMYLGVLSTTISMVVS